MILASEDRLFLLSLGRALLALVLSAAVMLTISIAYYQFHVPKGSVNSTAHNTIAGNEFQAVLGTTRIEGDTLVITGLETQADENHALVSTHIILKTEDYPFLKYKFDGLQAGVKLQFFWRTIENPGAMLFAPLPRNFDGTSTLNLASQPGWRGTATDLALYITGDLRNQPLTILSISLEPHSWQHLIAAIWSEWTAFRGWEPLSINNLRSTSNRVGLETVSPTVAMALWAAVALIILYIVSRFRPMTNLISYGAAMLIPWITLDQFWQSELSTQLQDTQQLFSGKTTHEKHLVDVDRNIYLYARRLKEEVLPMSPSRVFILHNSYGHDLERLKTQYYLLPNNIYNFNQWLPDQHIRPGDYILVLGALPGLSFDTRNNLLSWGGKNLAVITVDRDQRGTLYRVPSDADIPARPDDQSGEPNG